MSVTKNRKHPKIGQICFKCSIKIENHRHLLKQRILFKDLSHKSRSRPQKEALLANRVAFLTANLAEGFQNRTQIGHTNICIHIYFFFLNNTWLATNRLLCQSYVWQSDSPSSKLYVSCNDHRWVVLVDDIVSTVSYIQVHKQFCGQKPLEKITHFLVGPYSSPIPPTSWLETDILRWSLQKFWGQRMKNIS